MSKQKKDFGLVVWLVGWLLNVAIAMRKINGFLKVPFEAYERLGSPEGEVTIERIARLIREDWLATQPKPATTSRLPANHYRVSVTYAPLPSLDVLKWEFGEKCVSSIFNGRPFKVHSSCIGMDRTPGERIFYVHDVRRNWKDEERITWGLKQRNTVAPNGYRPATHDEEYEFSKAHPELLNYVALGDSALDHGDRYVAYVWQRGSRRILGRHEFDDWWGGMIRVLFVSR